MRIRFAACFSSIIPPVDKEADESRISFLGIRKNTRPTAIEDYERLLDMIETHITPDFGDRLAARTIANLPVLFANIKTFQLAVRRVVKEARAAQQIGTMLAGLYLLHSTGLVTVADAEAWVRRYDWRDHALIEDDSGPIRMVQWLAGAVVRYTAGGVMREETLGNVIVRASGFPRARDDDADRCLRQHSMKVENQRVYIANRSKELSKIFGGTDWSKRWGNALGNIEGAERHRIEYFSPAVKTSAVSLPIDMFVDRATVPEPEEEEIPIE